MTRTHYRQAAELLKTVREGTTTDAERMIVDTIAKGLADMFARDNGRFQRQTFYNAAEVGS